MSNIIFFDLEMSCGGAFPEIVSIGATHDLVPFHVYALPEGDISAVASEKHGIRKHNDMLYKSGVYVDSERPLVALNMFGEFVRDVQRRVPGQIHLMGHDAFNSDMHVLRHNIERFAVSNFPRNVVVMDSQNLARRIEDKFNAPVCGGRLGLDNLLLHLLGRRQTVPHDALQDAEAVETVVKEMHARFGMDNLLEKRNLF